MRLSKPLSYRLKFKYFIEISADQLYRLSINFHLEFRLLDEKIILLQDKNNSHVRDLRKTNASLIEMD